MEWNGFEVCCGCKVLARENVNSLRNADGEDWMWFYEVFHWEIASKGVVQGVD